ncbi:glycosyltransferase family 2 protein [Methanosarcina barkeri]|uniref:Glycosyl transferase GT2 family n=1 Tax=Methanosarcina barkeri CM1 TaxID=796385 RepID=A0A0G3CA61_METBA|nr:glycosyltransferase [Methanosarcina barkeri]AKJ38881.1 glycosyl transferase GT2 family [Methanosarcina barkeri CM1]
MDKTQEPLVSICCITYNHEKYIRDAIESFLMQKTDFPFEIIIHDDASTDRTADIIREYEKKYPEIIKPIYQTENQYSKGVKVTLLASKKAKGKYIALCEGDDYWTDPLKLHKQITEMEKYPKCHISFHPAVIKRNDENRSDKIFGLYSKKNKIFAIEKVISGGGGFMPTNSIVINKLTIPRIISFFEIAKNAPIGDYYIQILGSENGGALYISDVMSVYRAGVPGSWSERIIKFSKYLDSFVDSYIVTNDIMDEFTSYKYSKQLTISKKSLIWGELRSSNIEIEIRESLFKSHNQYISCKHKILWYSIFKHPKLIKVIKSLKSPLNT